MRKVAPLSSGFALISVLGFMVSAVYRSELFNDTWAFTFMLIFAIMFVASMISATKAPIEKLDAQVIKPRKKR